MISFSRRQLAKYAVDQLLKNRPRAIVAAHLAAALVASNRQKELELLLSDIDQELEERGLLAKAKLTSAFPLSKDLKQEIASKLKKTTKVKDIILQEQIDNTVIGGLKIETSKRSWDKTIQGTLANLKRSS